jgi:hypothetical protein
MSLHPAIRLDSVTRLRSEVPTGGEEPVGGTRSSRLRTAARHAAGRVLDRVGERAAQATSGEVDELRDELDRTRTELRAEIELLRAELEARDA